ncbi:hypothetical protein AYO25_05190 [Candidatus Liberibacter solanacearum]|uniref:Transmembrane protein n=1 Tax=Candidatus Liberibacter solanacearum TaxID=556287 RepID=A0A1V2N6V0_9HYPH|nr:hypothetical protein AYO25_05190 [Candidatus Liberibacter solanacearum]ONI59026.1 hypothetical protein AYJ09_01165 [Candidatus Liberibacter solanacearum]
MNKMPLKIDFIITSSIAWIIAWAIPLTYTGRSYIANYNYDRYMAFGLWILIPFCLLSSYCSCRILTNTKVEEYIQERWHELKHPIFIILLCFFLLYIIPLTGRMMYKLYCAESAIGGFINLAKLFLANTFLSTLYMQFYKTFRNKEIS